MNIDQVVEFCHSKSQEDLLCLGSRNGDLSKTLNRLEEEYPTIYNKNNGICKYFRFGFYGINRTQKRLCNIYKHMIAVRD